MLKYGFYLFIAWALFGCVAAEDVTRGGASPVASALPISERDWGPAEVVVTVPRSLSVSDSNVMRPTADIVWQEDPAGDRHAQVQTILTGALQPVVATLDCATAVRIELEVTRFHALTERARYTIGGSHEIAFDMRVVDARTGALLTPPQTIDLVLDAYGGRRAIEAEAAGQTQRVRITAFLQDWAREAFDIPDPA
jgi:hypothetical protein